MNKRFNFYLVLCFFTIVNFGFAQTESLFSRKILTNVTTSLLIDLKSETVFIESSNDDYVYIDYGIEFYNYSNRKKQKLINNFKLDVELKNNAITIKNFNKKHSFNFYNSFNFFIRADSTEIYQKKSKEDLVNNINTIKSYDNSYREYIENKYKNNPEKLKKERKRFARWDNRRNFKRKFVIKVPKYLKINIIGKGIQLKFSKQIVSQLNLKLRYSRLFAQKLVNAENKLKLDNTDVFIESISGGELDLENGQRIILGQVEDTKIKSEFSCIKIGEVGNDVNVLDFNGKTVFYNWQENISGFNYESEYSEVHLFPSALNKSIKLLGNNIKLFENGIDKGLQKQGTLINLINNTNSTLPAIIYRMSNSIIYKHFF